MIFWCNMQKVEALIVLWRTKNVKGLSENAPIAFWRFCFVRCSTIYYLIYFYWSLYFELHRAYMHISNKFILFYRYMLYGKVMHRARAVKHMHVIIMGPIQLYRKIAKFGLHKFIWGFFFKWWPFWFCVRRYRISFRQRAPQIETQLFQLFRIILL